MKLGGSSVGVDVFDPDPP